MLLRWWYLNSLAHFSLLISSLNSRSRGRYKEKVAPTSVLMVQSYRNLTMIQKSISGLLNHFYLRVLLIFDATRLIPKIKIDFCPNKRRLILQSCPLQLISIDSRSPSGLQSLPNFKMVIKMCFNSRSPSGLRRLLQRYNKKEILSKDKSRKSLLVIFLDVEDKAIELELTDNQPLRNSNKIMFTWGSQPQIFV